MISAVWPVLVALLLICIYRWYERPKNFPPGPRGIPFLGMLPFFGKYPEKKMKEWSKGYGAVMSVRLPTEDMIVLNDYDVVQQAFVKQSTKFSGRPLYPFFDQLTKGYGVIFRKYGEAWKTQRKFGLMTLRGLGVGKQSLEMKVIEETSYLNEAIREKNGKAFDPSILLHNAVSNTICNIVFGKRFEYDDPQFKAIMKGYADMMGDQILSFVKTVMTFLPILRFFPPIMYYNYKLARLFNFIMALFNKHIKDHEETFDESNIRDFIDAFLLELKKKEHHDSFSTEQLPMYVFELFDAGTVTTSNTLNWSLMFFLHYPEIQEKLRKEIEKVIDGKISMHKRSEMPYTCAFMEEVFRFRTLGPLSLFHSTSEHACLGEYIIPKETMVAANLWAIHNDEKVWKNPEEFNPDRFLNKKGEFTRSHHVIPFSVGPRHCLGEQLARMEFFVTLISLVQRFEFLPDPDADKLPDLNDPSNGILCVPKPFKLIAKEL